MRGVILFAILATSCASVERRVVRAALDTRWQEATYTPSEGESHAAALADLEHRLATLGIVVTYAPLKRGFGLADIQGRRILIEANLSPNGRLETLAHEAGHLFQLPTFSESEGQAFAELVGAAVCAKLGYDIAAISGRYLGMYKQGLAAALAAKVDREYAVAILTGREQKKEEASRVDGQ